jgi:hypothetical protein
MKRKYKFLIRYLHQQGFELVSSYEVERLFFYFNITELDEMWKLLKILVEYGFTLAISEKTYLSMQHPHRAEYRTINGLILQRNAMEQNKKTLSTLPYSEEE